MYYGKALRNMRILKVLNKDTNRVETLSTYNVYNEEQNLYNILQQFKQNV